MCVCVLVLIAAVFCHLAAIAFFSFQIMFCGHMPEALLEGASIAISTVDGEPHVGGTGHTMG